MSPDGFSESPHVSQIVYDPDGSEASDELVVDQKMG